MGATAGGIAGVVGLFFGLPLAIALAAGGAYMGKRYGAELDKDSE